jgi:hypothetical protein
MEERDEGMPGFDRPLKVLEFYSGMGGMVSFDVSFPVFYAVCLRLCTYGWSSRG